MAENSYLCRSPALFQKTSVCFLPPPPFPPNQGWLLEHTQRPTFSTLADWFRSMCSDPLHYLSTTVDRQIEDYSALPCNDAEEVDKHVYESPLDEEGYAVIPLETGQYDYPYGDEVCA